MLCRFSCCCVIASAYPSVLVPGLVLNYRGSHWWILRDQNYVFNHSFTVDQTFQIKSISPGSMTLFESNVGVAAVPNGATQDIVYYDSNNLVAKGNRENNARALWAYNDTLMVNSSYGRVNPYSNIKGVELRARLAGVTDYLHWFSVAPGAKLPILIDPGVKVNDTLTLWVPDHSEAANAAGVVKVIISGIVEKSVLGSNRQVVVGVGRTTSNQWTYPVSEELQFTWDKQTGILLTLELNGVQKGAITAGESYGKGVYTLVNSSILGPASATTKSTTLSETIRSTFGTEIYQRTYVTEFTMQEPSLAELARTSTSWLLLIVGGIVALVLFLRKRKQMTAVPLVSSKPAEEGTSYEQTRGKITYFLINLEILKKQRKIPEEIYRKLREEYWRRLREGRPAEAND